MPHLFHRQATPKRAKKMENKDITEDKINKITEHSPTREKAFFTFIRQSGLKPNTIKQLKIKHLEKIMEPDTPIPCKISITNEIEKNKFGSHPSFIAEEAINYLKNYLTERKLKDKEKLTPESLLFTIHNKSNKQIITKEMNRKFNKIVKEVIKSESTLQLNNLREFFIQKSKKIGQSHLNYLIGNPTNNNYTIENNEFYRELYKEVMDSLEIEPMRKSALRLRDIQIKEIKQQIEKIEQYLTKPKELESLVKQYNEVIKQGNKYVNPHTDLKNPEEIHFIDFIEPEDVTNEKLKQLIEERNQIEQKLDKYSNENPDEVTVDDFKETHEGYLIIPETRITKLEKELKDLIDKIKKDKETKKQSQRSTRYRQN